ncbi:MAG TPA: LysR family transcriptional regulator [Steroidobacteraceae bacterium]|jgi:DNA-binding transcriptional LysR family regulator
MPNPNLRDLAAFEAIVRHRNFRRAAGELRVSVSSLSERMRSLEQDIGARLLNRTTRSVAPTEAGERLVKRIVPALKELSEAVSDAGSRSGEPAGLLRINAPPPATQLVLAPMIAPFLSRHPKVSLEIVDDPLMVDIVSAGFDAGVRYEEHLAKDMVALSLSGPQRYAVVASPEFLSQFGTPKTPRDLLNAPCIASRFPGRAPLAMEFERAGRIIRIAPNPRFTALNMQAQLTAAIDGLGFFATFEGYAREALEQGRLKSVLTEWCPYFPGPFLYYPSRRQNPSSLNAFIAFVKEWRKT